MVACSYCLGVFSCLFFLQRHPVVWSYSSGLILKGQAYESRRKFMTRYLPVKEIGEVVVITAIMIVWRPRTWP